MKKSILAIITIATLTITSCNKQPSACIDAPATGTKGQSISFKSYSKNAHHTEWDFGDGTTATETSPTHIYSNVQTLPYLEIV